MTSGDTALEIAAAVRSGQRSARSVVEEHLARIDGREAELHAFNVVTGERALEAADAVDRRVAAGEDPGPLAGVPVALEGQHVHRGRGHHVLVEDPRGLGPALRRHGGHPPARRRGHRHRQDEPRRVRDGLVHRELGVRSHPQPARPLQGPGRLQRRQRRRRGRRLRAHLARVRHRRIDPPAGGALRCRRREADVRPGEPLRPRRLRVEPRPDRALRRHGGRRRRGARGPSAATTPPTPPRSPRSSRPSSTSSTGASRGCGSGSCRSSSTRRASPPTSPPAPRPPPRRSRRRGPRSRRSRCRP